MTHSSPPRSPSATTQRPMSAMVRPPPRSTSRMSMSSKQGSSRTSDDDSKTSVRVAVRIRPPLKSTDPGFELIPQRFQRSMVQVTSPTGLAVDAPQGRKLFVFDRVFAEDVYQQGVWEYVSESVNSFVQGYNVSILAYGQSGAGKSFTMGTSGPVEQGNKDLMGVIPRAATALFDKLGGSYGHRAAGPGMRTPNRYSTSTALLQPLSKSSGEKSWQMVATYVEIYNEQLRDLLVPEHVPLNERSAVTIREDTKGRILLTGLHQVTINSIEDLLGALNFGSMIRQTDATAINAKSSRSHAVFSLNLIQRRPKETPLREKRMSVPIDTLAATEGMVTVDSKLHFVDLAGSERLKNTGASGDRAKEGISINAGLASLGKVISQLSSRQAGSHVSYRDSKLTRLLQDSLGGNAVTYMIACVTPAEFHLSETLNTIQYAQRARAIQSKPRIQQVSDEADKQALIDRLRAEVSFLREQIRTSERSDRQGNLPQEKLDRQNEKEIELQNHLLDIQENYTALSHRHAKVISEITKDRGSGDTGTPSLPTSVGSESAMDRLKRSNSFADAVEQVVLEYEKTIQSLETSLSNARSSLSTTESNLLERETKCAYVETFNQQLQTRVQKLIDRESGTERYLHDLEAKMDGRNVGDEKASVIMGDLRKEIGRLRENETTCEEYISTLEERMAEAGQDMELMQREIGRLEHVVERQRSLGKLDNLLYELDHLQSNGQPAIVSVDTNGNHNAEPDLGRGRVRGLSAALLKVAMETPIPETDEDMGNESAITPRDEMALANEAHPVSHDRYPQSPAQSKFVEEKLETVNQELFDLRVEHESTINEYDLMSAKYEEALRTLAALQDVVDESRRPSMLQAMPSSPISPMTFLEDARVKELKNAGQSSSSRSLSSELSSAGESPITKDPNIKELHLKNAPAANRHVSRGESAVLESNEKTAEDVEHELGLDELQSKYLKLQGEHLDTLDYVEELKAEVQKAKMSYPTSPTSPVIRRKSSQTILSIDRAHRSLASLGNLASENFEDKPDIKQNFELNLSAVMHELHQRSERVEVLEIELASVKKEMENKMTIISGLTRERTTMKSSSPIDMSVISSMRDQMVQNEARFEAMNKEAAAREQSLTKEIQELKASIAKTQEAHSDSEAFMAKSSAAGSDAHEKLIALHSSEMESQNQRLGELRQVLSQMESKHNETVASMRATGQSLHGTIAELEASLVNVETMRQQKSAELESQSHSMATAAIAFDSERSRHAETISYMNKEIDEHKATINSYITKIAELEQSRADAQREAEEGIRYRQDAQKHLDLHRDQISALEQKLQDHQFAVESHTHSLNLLRENHAREIDDTRSSTLKQADADLEARLAEMSSHHAEQLAHSQSRIRDLESDVEAHEAASKEYERKINESTAAFNQLQEEKQRNSTWSSKEGEQLKEAHTKLKMAEDGKASAEASLTEVTAKVEELSWAKTELNAELVELREKEQRASRLVEELEGQLTTTYEQATTSRLSLMHNSQNSEAQEARAATVKAQEEIAVLTGRLEQLEPQRGSMSTLVNPHHSIEPSERTNSLTTVARKSTSVQSLPSPPPAIPLPPLPTGMPSANGPVSPIKDPSALRVEEQDNRIRTIEKHLFAEKQLTATLEEALVDLEAQGNKVKNEVESWKKKAWGFEDELTVLRKERNINRQSLQAVEEERSARKEAEAARANLEERMAALNKKKKKSTLNCF